MKREQGYIRAAGNRTDAGSSFDALNRPTALHGTPIASDVLGNRLSAGSTSYTWDAVNRLTHLSTGAHQTSYAYRADGMRDRGKG